MRVLTIISKLEMGGIEKTLLSCLPYLIEHGVKMSVLCSLGGALDKDYEALGVDLIDFGKHKKPFKDARFLKKLLLQREFDIVHSRGGHTAGLFAKVCHDLAIPFVVSLHNERAMFRNNWIGRPLLGSVRALYLNYHKRLTLKYATRIVGHSKANLKYFTNVVDELPSESQFQVLYNGVNFSKFHNYPSLSADKQADLDDLVAGADKVFIHIGSFKEQKNHQFLIDVFKRLDPIENKYRLVLLGVGPLMKRIQDYVKEQGLVPHVLFVGMQTNIAPYLHCSDLFIFPSLYEGFGNVLIEAQYMNLPVAASAIAPHYEATEKDYHRFLYNPMDVDDATEKIVKLLEDPDLDNRRKKARAFAEDFSIERMGQNLIQIFQQTKNG